MVKTLYKKNKRKNKSKKRGGSGSVLETTSEKVNTNAPKVLNAVSTIAFTAPRMALQVGTHTTMTGIQTADTVIQGTFAVISAIFGMLTRLFVTLPYDFNALVATLKTINDPNKQKPYIKKLKGIFKKFIKIMENSFVEIFKDYDIFNQNLQSQIEHEMRMHGCTRGLINTFSTLSFSKCKQNFNGNKQKTTESLNSVRLLLLKIRIDLKSIVNQVRQQNKAHYSKLELMLLSDPQNPELSLVMKKYRASVEPLIKKGNDLLSIETNTELRMALEEYKQSLQKRNAPANDPLSVSAINAVLNNGSTESITPEPIINGNDKNVSLKNSIKITVKKLLSVNSRGLNNFKIPEPEIIVSPEQPPVAAPAAG